MGVSPQQTWRGSYLENASNPQTKSACIKIINGAIIVFGISYLLYVLVIAIGPLVQPAHSAVRLRVHLRSGTGEKNAMNTDGSNEQLKAIMPGHNQAPSLQTGMEPELEALSGEESGKALSKSAVTGAQAASKEGKAFQQPLKQKDSGSVDQAGKLEDQESRKNGASAEIKKDWAAAKGNKTGEREGSEVEKELMISQQQREQLEKQLASKYDNVSEAE